MTSHRAFPIACRRTICSPITTYICLWIFHCVSVFSHWKLVHRHIFTQKYKSNCKLQHLQGCGQNNVKKISDVPYPIGETSEVQIACVLTSDFMKPIDFVCCWQLIIYLEVAFNRKRNLQLIDAFVPLLVSLRWSVTSLRKF